MIPLPPDIAHSIASASGFIFDMDGTIALGDAASGGHVALPNAVQTLDRIRARGVPLRVFTNGTAKTPAAYATSLRNAGFDLENHEMMTPSSSAAAWFVRQGIGRVRVLGTHGVGAPLRDLGIEVIGPSQDAVVEAVYTGWFREFTFPDLESACQSIWDGAVLTTASHVPFFATATGRGIGSSFAINKMVTALTGKPAKVLGKPSRIAFAEACHSMGITGSAMKRVVVIGDDPALEMRMANNAGVLAVGMTTGLLARGAMAKLKPREQPSIVLDSLAPLLAILR